MQTDSLLIIIKLDFSIKFQNLKEQLYTTNQNISFSGDGINLKFSKTEDEEFYYKKLRKVKAKNYSVRKIKSVSSTKGYKIYFDENVIGNLNFSKESLFEMNLITPKDFQYYFSMERVYQ